MLIKYIIISIIGSISNCLPISYQTHIFILNNLLNTNIFTNNNLLNSIYVSIPISIIIIYTKDIYKHLLLLIQYPLSKNKEKHKKEKNNIIYIIITSIISTTIITYIPKLPLTIKNTPIYLFILSIIIYISTNKRTAKKQLLLKDFLLFSISPILNIIPTISPLCSNLFTAKLLKIHKSLSIKLSLLTLIPLYIIKSIPLINFLIINTNYLPYYLLTIIVSIIINIKIINYLKDIYYQNKLYKLSIYTILLGLFLMYWYR